MQNQSDTRSSHWREHYTRQHALRGEVGLGRSLDYSNDRVLRQTHAHVLEALGPLEDQQVWDCGCGWGALSLLMHAAGASVFASDIVPRTIDDLRLRHPNIEWGVVDAASADDLARVPLFDRVVACEMLQYVEFTTAIQRLWKHVAPGGRLVASVSHRCCPIVRRVIERYSGLYTAVTEAEILALQYVLPELEWLQMKGLEFTIDQRLVPYAASAWSVHLSGMPNRILFVLCRTSSFAG